MSWRNLGAPGEIKVWNSNLFHPPGRVPVVFLFTEISEDAHFLNHIKTNTISLRKEKKKKKKLGQKTCENIESHLLKMRGQVCKLLISLQLWSCLASCARVPLWSPGQFEKLETVPPSCLLVKVHVSISVKSGTGSQAMDFKIRWVVRQGQGGDDGHLQI